MGKANDLTTRPSPRDSAMQIPIRNLWYLLLYAWGETPKSPYWAMLDSEDAPSIDGMLASVLVRLMQQRVRIGLERNYTPQQQEIAGIRGRVQFAQSIKQRSFTRQHAVCQFDEYTIDIPENRIILSTLTWLSHSGEFGKQTQKTKALKHQVRQTMRLMGGVQTLPLTPAFIQRTLQQRHDRDYHVMLSICAYLLQRRMPTETAGQTRFQNLPKDDLRLYAVFEKFVANFYRYHLADWHVQPQKTLTWPTAKHPNLPTMRPDLVLEQHTSGRIIVLDTKFTANSLRTNYYGNNRFDSNHLYQMYAYLRTQDHVSPQHAQALGILLYPTVATQLSETLTMESHEILLTCVDLAAEWQAIERQLLGTVSGE